MTILVLGAVIGVTKVSSAAERRQNGGTQRPARAAQCKPAAGPAAPNGRSVTASQQNGRTVRNHWADGQACARGAASNAAGNTSGAAGAGTATASCPSATALLKSVPPAARGVVVQNLSLMQRQFAEVNRRLKAGQNPAKLLTSLKNSRSAAINRITAAIEKAGARAPAGLRNAAGKCTIKRANAGGNNGGNANEPNNLGILGTKCAGTSRLRAHDGFQNGNRCVKTEMGEVGRETKNPSLLITDAPRQVGVNEPFQIEVSTRNLIRDRFLAAAQGGYYAEMSLLNAQGLVRGHFHTACRMLDDTNEAPDAAPAPAFFVATEDGGGGGQADTIVIDVPGLPAAGTAQCASWAGDGSHRIPMMQRANQTPAFDAVRVQVR